MWSIVFGVQDIDKIREQFSRRDVYISHRVFSRSNKLNKIDLIQAEKSQCLTLLRFVHQESVEEPSCKKNSKLNIVKNLQGDSRGPSIPTSSECKSSNEFNYSK